MDIFDTQKYIETVKQNNFNIINLLLKEGLEFAIITHTNVIEFNPPIPKEIMEFDKIARFNVYSYSYESSLLTKDSLFFEAGFGEENFGSKLEVPLEAIHQILLDDVTLSLNYHEPKLKNRSNSMDILLNNPKNLKLLKKRRKI